MARFRRNGWKNVVALVAAAVLVLQSLAIAQAAHPVLLDIFGNPICITGSDGSNHSVPGRGNHENGDCCLLGCGVAGAALPPAPAVVAAGWGDRMPALVVLTPAIVVPSPGHRPGNPRAPPLMA